MIYGVASGAAKLKLSERHFRRLAEFAGMRSKDISVRRYATRKRQLFTDADLVQIQKFIKKK